MLRFVERSFSPQPPDRDGVALAQTLGAAGPLALAGAALVSGGIAGFSSPARVSIYSTGNLSGVTFTVEGTDRGFQAISEDVVGPNNGLVVTTRNFLSVTAVTASGAVGTAVEAGAAATSETQWVPIDFDDPVAVSIDLSGDADMTYTVQYTLQNVFDLGDAALAHNATGLTSLTAVAAGSIPLRPLALRLAITNYVAGQIKLWAK